MEVVEIKEFSESEDPDQNKEWIDLIEKKDEPKLEKNKHNLHIQDDEEEDSLRPDLKGLEDAEEDDQENPDPLPRVIKNSGPLFEGFLITWGCGEFAQHGHGHCNDVPISSGLFNPLLVGQDGQVTHIACGSSHTLVITGDGRLFSWGNGNSGQLGIGSTNTTLQPHLVPLGVTPGTRIEGVACGTRHSFVWTEEGECFSFGNNYSAQLGYDFRKPDFKDNQLKPIYVDTLFNRKVLQVACGSRHSLFLFSNGHVAAVGCNNRGQIGIGNKTDTFCIQNVPDLTGVTVVACGNSHCLAADVQGQVWAWGYSKACGAREDLLSPENIFTSTDSCVKALSGGDSHSMILLHNGRLLTVGNNYEGQLGHGSGIKFLSSPLEVKHPFLQGRVQDISVGENTSAAVTDNGKLYMWGQNSSHVIREDEGIRHFQFEPYEVDIGEWRANKVSCGSWHVACIVSGSYTKPPNVNAVPLPPSLKPEKPVTPTYPVTSNQNDDPEATAQGVGNHISCDVSDDDMYTDYPLEETVVDFCGNVIGERPCSTISALEINPKSSPPKEEKPSNESDSQKADNTEHFFDKQAVKESAELSEAIENLIGSNICCYEQDEENTTSDIDMKEQNTGVSPDWSASVSASATGSNEEKPAKIEATLSKIEEEKPSKQSQRIMKASKNEELIAEVQEEKETLQSRVETVKPDRPKSRKLSAGRKPMIISRQIRDDDHSKGNTPVIGNVTIGFSEDNKKVERAVTKQPLSRRARSETPSSNERSSSMDWTGATKGQANSPANAGDACRSPLVKQLQRSPQLTNEQPSSPTFRKAGGVCTWTPGVVGQLHREKRPVRSLRKMASEDNTGHVDTASAHQKIHLTNTVHSKYVHLHAWYSPQPNRQTRGIPP
ncbi:uncharacterized protein LOC5505968 isoform X2 [Nematostella vectensis]|uniref:uncharacterized protein LOC5505968 isoform X2 n=1 Tax=Nematostella vectensis TaxID=45351 RepID=UPI002076E119|nr:uncharacterized protein LOC5505968 isoform X2 [Nematostella vectensis]